MWYPEWDVYKFNLKSTVGTDSGSPLVKVDLKEYPAGGVEPEPVDFSQI